MKLPEELEIYNAITKVEQITIEDEYSRTNIRAFVKRNALAKTGEFSKILNKCYQCINEYRDGDYYESKNQRLAEIVFWQSEDLVIEMMIAVMPCERRTSIQQVATKIAVQLDYDDIIDGVKTASEMLGACARTGLFNAWVNPLEIKTLIPLSQVTLDFIENTKYLPPMVCKPKSWTSNTNGGYLSVRKSALLNSGHHSEILALDALNISQEIEWELDIDMVNYIEKPTKPVDTDEKKEAHMKMAFDSLDTYQDMVDRGNAFYFNWRYDSRGRMYSQGYHINIQSTEYKKSILNFKHKEVIQ